MPPFMLPVLILLGLYFCPSGDIRMLTVEEQPVATTYKVASRFLGIYRGRKSGFLELRADGSGFYRYDLQGLGKDGCQDGEIPIVWGFIVAEDGSVVRFERPYGYSYPIVYLSTSHKKFQGCSRSAMVDYLLEHRSGMIAVSSSDDWVRQP
jgi:hypothetical protein